MFRPVALTGMRLALLAITLQAQAQPVGAGRWDPYVLKKRRWPGFPA